jgi:large subunit ribosomal protein L31
MRDGIHPSYAPATITCGCGNTMETQSTKQNMRIDVCSRCHPFYTGEQRLIDTGGQVERFRRRTERARAAQQK